MLFFEIALWFEGCNHLMACQIFFLTMYFLTFSSINFIDTLGVSYSSLQFHSFPSPPIHFSPLQYSATKQNLKKKKTKILHLFCLSNTSLFILVALGAVVCSRVYPFAQTALLANGHCNESGSMPLTSGIPPSLGPPKTVQKPGISATAWGHVSVQRPDCCWDYAYLGDLCSHMEQWSHLCLNCSSGPCLGLWSCFSWGLC